MDLLSAYTSNPDLIVNKRIKHKAKNEDGTEEAWYIADILEIVKRSEHDEMDKVRKETFYHIRYEIDNQEWDFPLLQDIKNGDLIIH